MNATAHPLYETWRGMKRRCHDPKYCDFKDYGAKGTRVCDAWRLSFWRFVEDMGERPDGCTLDRVDPHGDYEPANCRWAPAEIQWRNKKNTRTDGERLFWALVACGALRIAEGSLPTRTAA